VSGRAVAEPAGDQVAVTSPGHALELTWSDAEDRVHGFVEPVPLRAGTPLKVHVDVGSFEGKGYDGPVTFQLRKAGEKYGEPVLAMHNRGYSAELHPREDGNYLLDITFRTTRLKMIHASLTVEPARIPLAVWWTLLGVIAACAGAYVLVRRRAPPTTPSPAP
jgi:hypothetical protein